MAKNYLTVTGVQTYVSSQILELVHSLTADGPDLTSRPNHHVGNSPWQKFSP